MSVHLAKASLQESCHYVGARKQPICNSIHHVTIVKEARNPVLFMCKPVYQECAQ